MEAAVAIGALSMKQLGSLNLINAPTLAKEAGLQVGNPHTIRLQAFAASSMIFIYYIYAEIMIHVHKRLLAHAAWCQTKTRVHLGLESLLTHKCT